MHLPTRPSEFVVTLGIDFADGKEPARILVELFRGDAAECMELMFRVSTPSHDRRSIEHWWMQYGPAVDWEAFARTSLDLAAR
jgi:hypothetical protein